MAGWHQISCAACRSSTTPPWTRSSTHDALEIPLVKFRSEVSKYSDGMRAQGWEPEFAANAEDVFVREVAPAVQEIEEMVRDDRFLAALWPRMSRPQDWAAGGTFGMLAFNLASLPEITSLAVGGTVGLAATARNTYLEHRDAQRAIEGHRLFFYREAGRRLAGS